MVRPAVAHEHSFEGRYELIAKLGEGGFGTVHKARQRTTGQLVAVKVMRLAEPWKGALADARVVRFLREVRLCAQLCHPNIVQIVDSGQTADGDPYTVFAYAPGDTLADVLAAGGPLAPREARHLMLQVLDGLACAHAQGIVHRDLKPSNIMIVATGARRNAVILDFGIGAMVDAGQGAGSARLTTSRDALGTPGYGAPEQSRGAEPSPSADIFSWGLVFIECLTGAPVYAGASAAEIFYQLLGPDPVPMPPVLERHPLGALLRRAVHKDVAVRASRAGELFDALDACELPAPSWDRASAHAPAAPPLDVATSATWRITASRPPGAERRHVTGLVCRIGAREASGHARGASSADPQEAVDEALRSSFALTADVARRSGGYVAAALGDELLVVFGYPRAEEDDARRAARAALAIVSAIRTENHRRAPGGIAVDVTIGVHSGPVLAGDERGLADASLALGATPRTAAAVAASAAPGCVMVTAAARRLIRMDFDLGPPALLGAGASEAFELLGERVDGAALSERDAAAPLVGRDREVELLLERWKRARGGMGHACLLTGEPGIGKSRLAHELRARLFAEDYTFLESRCSPDTRHDALFPISTLLKRELGLDGASSAEEKVRRLEAELRGFGFELADAMPLFLPFLSFPAIDAYPAPDVSPQRQKTLTLDAIAALLAAMADRRPVLLLVEDLHWSDATTLELIAQLTREIPSIPMCALMTARPEFQPSFSTSGWLQLHLSRLDRGQIEAMVVGLAAPKSVKPAAVDQVVSRTDGVPLFVEEMTRTMIESGWTLDADDHYGLPPTASSAEVPSTLRALLAARLDRLERAKDTAQLASALGREFSIDVLAAVSSLGSVAVEEDLTRLVTAGLVIRKLRPKDPVGVFKHALVRDAAYDTLSRPARLRVHARIASTLEERFPDVVRTRPDLLAHHHAAAEQREEAARYAQQAAERGLKRSAYDEAIAHASNVLGWAGAYGADERIEVELAANGVMTQALMATRGWGDREVKATVDRSTRLLQSLHDDSRHKIPTLWSLFTYHHVASNRGAAREVAEELVAIGDRAGDVGLRSAAATLEGIALHADGSHDGARGALERAIALYDPALHRDHGERFGLDSLVLAKTLLARVRWFSHDAATSEELVTSAVEWAREIRHVPSLAIGLLYGCQVYQFAGDKRTVKAMTSEIMAISNKFGLPAYEGYAAILHAWAIGEEQSARAISSNLAKMGCRICLSYYASLVADTLAELGDVDAAIACIDECLALCGQNDEHFHEPELHRRRAMFRLQKNPRDDADARSSLEEAVRLARSQSMPRTEAMATSALLRHFRS